MICRTARSDKGQTLLIVVFAMSLGLLVMVSVASRTVSSVARATQTNYYQKATAAAEGGAEVFLLKSFVDLKAAMDPLTGCPASELTNLALVKGTCKEIYNIGGVLDSVAYIGVESYPSASDASKVYEVKAAPGETLHINLEGSTASSIKVCWMGVGSNNANSISSYALYSGVSPYEVKRDTYKCNSSLTWCPASTGDLSSEITLAAADSGYSCYTVGLTAGPIALRIFNSPGSAVYRITAQAADLKEMQLPQQGYRVISIGEVTTKTGGSLESKKATRKKVVVERTLPVPMGPWFDFAVSSIEGTVSNTP